MSAGELKSAQAGEQRWRAQATDLQAKLEQFELAARKLETAAALAPAKAMLGQRGSVRVSSHPLFSLFIDGFDGSCAERDATLIRLSARADEQAREIASLRESLRAARMELDLRSQAVVRAVTAAAGAGTAGNTTNASLATAGGMAAAADETKQSNLFEQDALAAAGGGSGGIDLNASIASLSASLAAGGAGSLAGGGGSALIPLPLLDRDKDEAIRRLAEQRDAFRLEGLRLTRRMRSLEQQLEQQRSAAQQAEERAHDGKQQQAAWLTEMEARQAAQIAEGKRLMAEQLRQIKASRQALAEAEDRAAKAARDADAANAALKAAEAKLEQMQGESLRQWRAC